MAVNNLWLKCLDVVSGETTASLSTEKDIRRVFVGEDRTVWKDTKEKRHRKPALET